MEIIFDDLMAFDAMATEAKKFAVASKTPITAPRIHAIISPFPYADLP